MKRIISLTIWLVFLAWSFAVSQDTTASVEYKSYYRDSLTVARDTVDVKFLDPTRFNIYTITAYSDAVDTLSIFTLLKTTNGDVWVQHGSVDLADNTDETTLNITTTKHEYLLLDPQPSDGIRIISSSNDGSYTIIVVQGKKQE